MEAVFGTGASGDFWEEAIHLGDRVEKYAMELIHKAGASNVTVAIQLGHFKNAMVEVVSSVHVLREKVQTAAEARGNGHSLEKLSDKLSAELGTIFDDLKKDFPPPENATHHQEREVMIATALSKVEDSLVHVLSFGVSEEDTRAHFRIIERHVKALLVLVGDLAEQHPLLLETLLISGAFMCMPEMWFLRPFLGIFGFGPYGPVKGSAAAWAQRRFWGVAIVKGSWFAHLQSAGMKAAVSWWASAFLTLVMAFSLSGCKR